MYPGKYAQLHAERPAFIMASTGLAVTHAELEQRSNRLAHLFRAQGLQRLDHYAVFMENNDRFLETCVAGERSGLYYTCVNSYLTADELAYILNNSESQLLITSLSRLAVAKAALLSSSISIWLPPNETAVTSRSSITTGNTWPVFTPNSEASPWISLTSSPTEQEA